MNAMTSMIHSQMLLPPRMMALYGSGDDTVRPQTLSWSTLYQWLNSQTWRRMVKREQDGKLDTLVICGFFRIVKHETTQRVFMQRKCVQLDAKNNPLWSWVSTPYCPDFMLQSLQTNLGWRFRHVLEFVVKALLDDLAKQGVVSIETSVKGLRQPYYDGVMVKKKQTLY